MSGASKATLPRVPSQLIRIALEDLEKVEAMPETYMVDMYAWHEPLPAGRCAVCLAGAVMAMRLSAPPETDTTPGDFQSEDMPLSALNRLRRGIVGTAFFILGLDYESGESFSRPVPLYEENARAFKDAMRRLASDLEAAGY